ncbi:MAG: type III pantothenate kinase [Pseudomonadota bacterium]
MLLAIDVGNTNIVFGVYKGDELIADWRLVTDHLRTGDEYGMMLQGLFASQGIPCAQVTGSIISCVVPQVLSSLQHVCRRYFNKAPLLAGPGIHPGITIRYEQPAELGTDRIVNAVAAYEKYRRSLIVIDFGTATTFDYVSPDGEFSGGAIAPGIATAGEALFQRASKLPRIEFLYPGRAVGRNTVESLQTGIVLGYVCLVDGIVEKIREEVKTGPYVVATGGLAPLIAAHTTTINDVDDYLTLRGLKFIFDKNL